MVDVTISTYSACVFMYSKLYTCIPPVLPGMMMVSYHQQFKQRGVKTPVLHAMDVLPPVMTIAQSK